MAKRQRKIRFLTDPNDPKTLKVFTGELEAFYKEYPNGKIKKISYEYDGEIWEDIEGYNGMYQISSKGRIKSLPRKDVRGGRIPGRFLNPWKDAHGELVIVLSKNRKKREHRISSLMNKHFPDE